MTAVGWDEDDCTGPCCQGPPDTHPAHRPRFLTRIRDAFREAIHPTKGSRKVSDL